MRTKTFRTVLYGMTLLTVSACVEEHLEQDVLYDAEVRATIQAPASAVSFLGDESPGDATRTFIDENESYSSGVGTLWRTKEVIGVYSSWSKNAKFTSTNTKSAGSVAFRGLVAGTPQYAYYPYSEANNGVSHTAVKGNIPLNQAYSQTYRDIEGDYRAGTFDSKTWFSSTFTFNRLVSILKFTLDATGTALEGDRMRSITFKVNNNRQLSGDFTINLETQETTPATFADGSDSLNLTWTDQPQLLNGYSYRAYMTSLPTLQKGDEITFVITTNNHVATFKRASKVTFVPNGVVNYPLTLANFPDMEVTEIVKTPVVTPELLSMKFTVADNPGKILSRKFSVSTKAAVTTSTVTEEVCTIDAENGTVSLYVPYLNNRNLVPVFEIPEGTKLVLENGDEVVSGETVVDFVANKTIAVVNSKNQKAVYEVNFTNTGLPVVVVNQLSGTRSSETNKDYTKASKAWYDATGTMWQPKDADWSMEEGDNFMVYNADGTSALSDKNGELVTTPALASTRLRGNVTQQMPKKPFAVKLDKKHGIFMNDADTENDLPAHKRWVLLSNWKDRTLMRNEVAFGLADVFQQTFPNDGLAWNPSGQFVELVYNGVHVGNYYLCEHIKIDGNRLDITDPFDEKDGYSGTPEDYGYLLEADDGYDETWKFTTANYIPFLFKDDGNDEMLSYVAGLVRGVEDKLYAGNYSAAYEQLDITSLVDYWLIQEVMMNSEMKHPKSVYMYLNKGKLYAGPIWDFDWNTLPVSSSYAEEGYSYTSSMLAKAQPYHKRSGYPTAPFENSDKNYLWYPMLVKDASFKALAAERWGQVKSALLSYVETIPAKAAAMKTSEALNNAMWPVDTKGSFGLGERYSAYGVGGGYCGDEGYSYEKAVETLVTTLKTRINGMNYVTNQSWPTVSYTQR
ncbi:MAG: CotH kinase family protein [Bacteroidaceae bacterium]|nr:CotH kinase family protein [Bacteroidaceae bacterium]